MFRFSSSLSDTSVDENRLIAVVKIEENENFLCYFSFILLRVIFIFQFVISTKCINTKDFLVRVVMVYLSILLTLSIFC